MTNFLGLWQRSVHSWGVDDWLVLIVVLAAACGITYLACQFFEIVVPPIFLRILLICAVAVVAILAIRFLFTL